ncbi:MAG: c-type cytochrome domain-containing protein [Planctomycetota bacterium]
MRLLFLGIVSASLLPLAADATIAQELTAKEKRSVSKIAGYIESAGKAYKSERFASSASSIKRAIRELENLVEEPRQEILDAIDLHHARIKKARELLIGQGQKLPELAAMPAAKPAEGATPISFKDTVAPIIIAKCGNCHVNQNRGDFSTASYTALMDSTMVAFGKPDESRFIEVIESGEMPKGGLKVSDDELKSLKGWIAQGAKFDGSSEAQNLRQLTGAGTPTPPRRQRMAANKPTGNETVSFGRDIAPVLIEQCADCHVARRPRGNFSMANFQTFLRGGDGGNPVVPGDVSASALIKRLHGDGAEQMPPDRKLDDEVIKKFETWVKEGATFDGDDVTLDFITVAAAAKAASMSHEELVEDRKQQTIDTWKLAMGDVESKMVSSENFLVAASTGESRLDDVAAACEKMAAKVASTLKVSKKQPLVKGNMSVYVFSKRYDFGEFGRMVERREFPKEVDSHWNFDTINAYAVVLMTRNQTADDVSVDLTRQIAALRIASLSPDVPRWFANGMGLWAAKRIHSRDESLKTLDADAETAANNMERMDDFVQNRMPGDEAAKVAYLFVKKLKTRSGPAFSKLMKGLDSGQSFEKSFSEAYQLAPDEIIKKLSGR